MIVPTHATAHAHAGELPAIATGFVRKLYRILDQESGAVITWTRNGTAFAISDDERLNELILPRYFRGRLCAFRQQLREHGFQQLLPSGAAVPIAPVAPPQQPQLCTYFHEHFVRGSPGRLCKIARTPLPRRRLSNRKSKAVAAKRSAAVAPASAATAEVRTKRARVTSSSSSSTTTTSASSSSTSTLSSSTTSSSTTSLLSSSATSLSTLDHSVASLRASAVVPPPQLQLPLLQQQQLLPLSRPLSTPPTLHPSKNPLFSTESDGTFGDWLSLDDISCATGAGASGVTTDIAFSEDMLGALMTLVSNSMTSVGPAQPPVAASVSVAASCAVQKCKQLCAAATAAGSSSDSSSAAKLSSAALAQKAVASGPTLYETHQFSDDTINSMLLWLGTGSQT